MADNKMVPGGTGTPYVAVFGIGDLPIIDPISKLPLGMLITNFFYQYDEEKGNTCEITFETDNPDIIDIPTLKPKMPLKIQWGYIYPNGNAKSGPIKRMVIDDIEGKWNESGITYIIKCTTPIAILKDKKAQLFNRAMADFIINSMAGQFAIEIIDYSESNTTGTILNIIQNVILNNDARQK